MEIHIQFVKQSHNILSILRFISDYVVHKKSVTLIIKH